MDYPITLSGVPSGSGMYQQLLTINPSTYGISSSGGNVLFYDSSNSTPLYAWLQSINSTSASYWIKNFNGSNGITMRVVPNADYFSSTGYLGEASYLDNYESGTNNQYKVFGSTFYDFNGTNFPLIVEGDNGAPYFGSYSINNGMNLVTNSSSAINVGTSTSFSMPVAFTLTMGAVATSAASQLQFINQYSALQIGDAGLINLQYGTASGAEDASTSVSEPTGSGINSYLMVISDTQIQVFFNGKLVIDNTSVNNENNKFVVDFLDYELGNSPVIYQMGVADTGITTMPTYSIGSGSSVTISDQPTYQQLLTISSPSSYGINSQGSNVQFTASNGSLLYAWIQSINSTLMQVWVKNYYGNSVVDLQVLPSFENLFSSTGYLGFGRQYWNAPLIFPYSTNLSTGTGLFFYGSPQTATFTSSGMRIDANGSSGMGLYFSFDSENGRFNSYISQFNGTGHLTFFWGNGFNTVYPASTGLFSTPFTQPNAGYNYEMQSGTFSGNATIAYTFFNASVIMPTFTIGSPSVFQANANPQSISAQVTAPVGYGGNATYQLYSYDIPVGPNMHYLTVLYASTDYFSDQGTTPATYLLFPQYHFITFFNISGFTQIYVSLLEPSSLLGQSVPVTIQPVQNNNSVVIPDVHLSAVYESFGTSTPVQAVSYGTTVTLPYGSTASFLLYNQWNQQIGSLPDVQIDSLTPLFTMNVSIATLSFQFINASESPVSLTSNGITSSGFFGSAQVALGYSYVWQTSVYDQYSGQNQNYTGSVLVTKINQVLKINTQSAASSILIYVNSYGPSQQGQLGMPGEPSIILTVDGANQTPGETYVGFVGSTYQIKVTDVLGQLLYEGNLTVHTTVTTYIVNI